MGSARKKGRWVRVAANIAAVALLASACGGDGASNNDADAAGAANGNAPNGDDGSIEEVTLQVSSPVGEAHPGQVHMRGWAERVTELTDGAVQFEYTYGGALLPIDEDILGVGDGRVEMSYGSPHYYPTELPLTSVGELPFITRNAEAQMKAAHDLFRENDAVAAEWESLGVKPLIQVLIGSSLLGSDQELTGISDLQGLQIRASGAVAETFDAAGANIISIPFPELYESAQRGLVDAVGGLGFTGFQSGELYTVAPIIHDPGHGEAIAFQTIVINEDIHESLGPDVHAAIDQATEEYYAEVADLVAADEEAACRTMLEGGAEFIVWEDDAVAEWGPLIGDELQSDWVEDMDARGLPGDEVLSQYIDLVNEYEAEASYVPAVDRCIEISEEG